MQCWSRSWIRSQCSWSVTHQTKFLSSLGLSFLRQSNTLAVLLSQWLCPCAGIMQVLPQGPSLLMAKCRRVHLHQHQLWLSNYISNSWNWCHHPYQQKKHNWGVWSPWSPFGSTLNYTDEKCCSQSPSPCTTSFQIEKVVEECFVVLTWLLSTRSGCTEGLNDCHVLLTQLYLIHTVHWNSSFISDQQMIARSSTTHRFFMQAPLIPILWAVQTMQEARLTMQVFYDSKIKSERGQILLGRYFEFSVAIFWHCNRMGKMTKQTASIGLQGFP